MTENIAISEQIIEQARSWYVRLGSEQANADDWISFTEWLEEHPLHVDAYDRVELALLDAEVSSLQSDDVDNVVPFITKPKSSKTAPKNPAFAWGRFAGIAALFIAALTVYFTNNPLQDASVQTYATKIGGHKEIVLADGTRINLNTNTQISVALSKKTRTVTLKNGEVFFDIASDKNRPFIVNAMGTKITDVGTSFSVYASNDALTISVADGLVDVQSAAQTTRLKKGQLAIQKRGDNKFVVNAIDIESISTWRDDILVFEDSELSIIIPELNRYFERPILISDQKVADLKFSGVLNISNQDIMLESMVSLMPIKSKLDNGKFILISKN